ncbi:MAG: YdcH family protein [Acidobacteriota bacterium]
MEAPEVNAILEQNDDYRRLAEKHRRCEGRLKQLQDRSYLIPEEQIEEVRLKKEKLALKDQMAAIERRIVQEDQLAAG